jgi:hypothetical protein
MTVSMFHVTHLTPGIYEPTRDVLARLGRRHRRRVRAVQLDEASRGGVVR